MKEKGGVGGCVPQLSLCDFFGASEWIKEGWEPSKRRNWSDLAGAAASILSGVKPLSSIWLCLLIYFEPASAPPSVRPSAPFLCLLRPLFPPLGPFVSRFAFNIPPPILCTGPRCVPSPTSLSRSFFAIELDCAIPSFSSSVLFFPFSFSFASFPLDLGVDQWQLAGRRGGRPWTAATTWPTIRSSAKSLSGITRAPYSAWRGGRGIRRKKRRRLEER